MYPTVLVVLVTLTKSHVEHTLKSAGLHIQGGDEIAHRRAPARRLEDLSTVDIFPGQQFGQQSDIVLISGAEKSTNRQTDISGSDEDHSRGVGRV
jgi:hypothetical protein